MGWEVVGKERRLGEVSHAALAPAQSGCARSVMRGRSCTVGCAWVVVLAQGRLSRTAARSRDSHSLRLWAMSCSRRCASCRWRWCVRNCASSDSTRTSASLRRSCASSLSASRPRPTRSACMRRPPPALVSPAVPPQAPLAPQRAHVRTGLVCHGDRLHAGGALRARHAQRRPWPAPPSSHAHTPVVSTHPADGLPTRALLVAHLGQHRESLRASPPTPCSMSSR